MNTIRALSIPGLCLLLFGCGGGGDSSSTDSGGGSGTPATTVLGTRAVPGYLLVVSADHPPVAGATSVLTVEVTSDSGMHAPQAISAGLINSNDTPNLVPGQPVSGVTNQWTWSVTMPADLTGQRVVVQILDAHGNGSMSGVSDFALAP